MADYNTTAKFRMDVSDLKKGIQDSIRQIKLANAEFKTAAAGMDNWSKSADGLSAKIKQTKTVLQAEKNILASYEKQLELVVKEYGENSKEADNMRIKVENQRAAVAKSEKALKDLEKQLDKVEQEEKGAAEAAEKQDTAYEELKKTIDTQESELKDLKKKYSEVVLEQGKNSESAEKLASEIRELSGDLAQNKSKLREADQAAEDLDASLDDLSSSAEGASNRGLSTFGVMLGNLAANVINDAIMKVKELARETVQLGIDFDSAMSKVQAISGASAEQYDQLREKAKEMGATTKYSASDAASAFEYMAMAGWKTDDMLEGVNGIMSLAAASGAELGTTSDIVTDALTAFGMSAGEAGDFADILAAASANANTNVEMMGESFKYVAPVAGSLGYSAEDVSTALGLMANSGIKASQAGTSLRSVLNRMSKQPKEAATAMDRLGISLTDDEGKMYSFRDLMIKMREGFKDLKDMTAEQEETLANLNQELEDGVIDEAQYAKEVEELVGPINEATGATKAQVAAMLAGTTGMSGLLAVVNASDDDFNKLTKAIDESQGSFVKLADGSVVPLSEALESGQEVIEEYQGAAEAMMRQMEDNLGGDMDKFRSKLESVQLTIYEKLEPALRDGVEALTGLLDVFNWLIDHGDQIVAVLAAMAAGVGAYVAYTTAINVMREGWLALTVVQKAVTAAQWLMNAAMNANPIGILIAAITALVAAFIYLWKNNEDFRKFWLKLWDQVKSKFQTVVAGIKSVIATLKAAFDSLRQKVENVKTKIVTAFTNIKDKANEIKNNIVNTFTALKDKVETLFNDIKSKITKPIDDAKSLVSSAVDTIKGLFPISLGKIFSGIKLPHFIISGGEIPWGIGGKGTPPSVSIEWYRRGGVIDGAHLIGVGEAGAEAVVPLEENKKWIAATARQLRKSMQAEGVIAGATGGAGAAGSSITFNQYNNSPKALSRLEIYRQTRNQLGFARGL